MKAPDVKKLWPGTLSVWTGILIASWVLLGRRYAIAGESLHEGFCYLIAITLASCSMVEVRRRRAHADSQRLLTIQNNMIEANAAALREQAAALRQHTAELQFARGGIVDVPLQPRAPQ